MPDLDDDELTELVDFDCDRVDAVGKGANGVGRWLIAKQAEDSRGLVPPGMVRELIGKQAEPDAKPEPASDGPVTMTGSPAAMAAFIHKASQRASLTGGQRIGAGLADELKVSLAGVDTAMAGMATGILKGKYSADDLKAMGAKGRAFKNPDGSYSYPVGDTADLGNAIHAVGRGGAGHDAIRKYVIKRARALGASGEIPDNWAADGSLKEASVSKTATVAKDVGPELDTGVDGMDPTVPLAAPDEDAPGDPADPGSPAWEAIDAATAQKWTSIAVRLKNALGVLAEREMLEAASADPDDIENAFDLEDAMCAVDYVISELAVYAADEQAEADLGGEALEAIGKAMAAFDPAPLVTVEGLCAVAKSGRVLSSANETHIREAAQRLTTVLSSLPQAPVTDDGQPVAKQKEAAVTATVTAPAQVAKADADEQAKDTGPVNAGGTAGMGTPKGGDVKPLPGDLPGREVLKSALALVYDQERRLIGVTSAAEIVQQVAKADGEKAPMQAVFDQNGDLIGIVAPDAIQPVTGAGKPAAAADGDDPAADAAPAADPADMTPAPPAETGTPADAVDPDGTVAKSSDSDRYAVLESIVAKAVAAAFGTQGPAQDIAKQADVAGLSEQVETLKARLVTVENSEAAPKVFTNGQVPPASQLRGQDQGAAPVDVAKAAELRETLYHGSGPEQAKAFHEMELMAVTKLAQIRANPQSPAVAAP